jgi:hypothetical protein
MILSGPIRWFRVSPIILVVMLLSVRTPTFALAADSSQPLAPDDLIRIHNTSGSSQTNRPVSVARPFVEGEIHDFAQASISGTPLLTQCDVKNRWADGSLKFAIVSFVVPSLPAKGSVVVSFSNQSSGNNTGFLEPTAMLDPLFDFEAIIQMTGTTTQTVSARQMLSNHAFRYWLKGPVVTAVLIEDRSPARTYDKDFGDGSKALHPIFEAWFYPEGHKIQIGYTVENTWVSSNPGIDARDETYSLTLTAGLATAQTIFANPRFTHIGLSRWHQTAWAGTLPPGIRVDHNIRYLVRTRAVPNYDTSLKVDSNLIANKYGSWVKSIHLLQGGPNGIGNYEKALGAGGAADWIGLMNTWDVIYLLTMDDRMLAVSRGNADLAGRIPWHFREADSHAGTGRYFETALKTDTFGRMVSINARKQITLSDLAPNQCDAPIGNDEIKFGTITDDGWGGNTDRSHIPDVAYIPYLLSGSYYYLEELQYQAAWNVAWKIGCFASTLAYPRQGDAGYINDSQLRGNAWAFRTIAYASFISPDDSPEKAYFEGKLRNNIALWEGARNITLSDPTREQHWKFGFAMQRDPRGESPIGSWQDRGSGFVEPPLRTDGSLLSAASPWEENFMTVSLGMARDLGYPTEGLLKFQAKRLLNQVLNPNTNHFLIEAYRYPTITKGTKWIQTWPENDSYYSSLPTNWRALGTETADHSYGFIAMAAISFVYPYGSGPYKGADAWEFIRKNKPNQQTFATESPKWDILPRKE